MFACTIVLMHLNDDGYYKFIHKGGPNGFYWCIKEVYGFLAIFGLAFDNVFFM